MAEQPASPTVNLTVTAPTTLPRPANKAIDAALGPEHEEEPHHDGGLEAPGTQKRRGSVTSQGSKKSFAESVMTVLSASGRVIKKGVHKVGKVLEEGISAP
jgi:hypothetical protein